MTYFRKNSLAIDSAFPVWKVLLLNNKSYFEGFVCLFVFSSDRMVFSVIKAQFEAMGAATTPAAAAVRAGAASNIPAATPAAPAAAQVPKLRYKNCQEIHPQGLKSSEPQRNPSTCFIFFS